MDFRKLNGVGYTKKSELYFGVWSGVQTSFKLNLALVTNIIKMMPGI